MCENVHVWVMSEHESVQVHDGVSMSVHACVCAGAWWGERECACVCLGVCVSVQVHDGVGAHVWGECECARVCGVSV